MTELMYAGTEMSIVIAYSPASGPFYESYLLQLDQGIRDTYASLYLFPYSDLHLTHSPALFMNSTNGPVFRLTKTSSS
jgi:hypothetical protein